jgi:hypothetical protein
MFRHSRYIITPALFAVAAALTISAAVQAGPQAAPSVRPAAAPTALVPAGQDFATHVFHDAWDYSNSADAILDGGPQQGLSHPAMSGGMLSFAVHSGYLTPLWGGYKSEVPTGRLGTLTSNTISASIYRRLHVHIYVSAFTAAGLSWYTCSPRSSACEGSMTFGLKAGWNDIDVPISRDKGKGWSGHLQGLRFALTRGSGSGSVNVHLDSLRVYNSTLASSFTWAAPGATSAKLWYTDLAGTINATTGQHSGLVANAGVSPDSSNGVRTSVAGYAPGTSFWSVSAGGTKTLVGRTAIAPLPVVDSQPSAGCGGYSWKFTSAGRLASHANMAGISYSKAGVLTATNAAPHRNDPNISLPISRTGIDGRVYHRLTFVESYDGGFGLANAPGGGAMARILWQKAGHVALSQTSDLVTFRGKQTVTVDMGMSSSRLIEQEGTAAQRYVFGAPGRIHKLRYDPNEDPGARRWHLYSVRLAADCHAALSTTITWHDVHYTVGSTVRIEARTPGGHTYPLGTTTEHHGSNSHGVSVRSLPRGQYTISIYVTTPGNITTAAGSSGPFVKT